jgi:hypothetical protein
MSVHGYSMLRPTLNQDYFHEIYDAAEEFGVGIEGHRASDHIPPLCVGRANVQIPRLDQGCSRRPWLIPRRHEWRTMHACSS